MYGPESSACVCVSRRAFFADPTQLHVGRARRIRLLRPCRLELPLADADQALEQALDPLEARVHICLAANELLELRRRVCASEHSSPVDADSLLPRRMAVSSWRNAWATSSTGSASTQQPAAAQRADADPVDEVPDMLTMVELKLERRPRAHCPSFHSPSLCGANSAFAGSTSGTSLYMVLLLGRERVDELAQDVRDAIGLTRGLIGVVIERERLGDTGQRRRAVAEPAARRDDEVTVLQRSALSTFAIDAPIRDRAGPSPR